MVKIFSYDSKIVIFFPKELNKIQLFIKGANGLAEETSLHPLTPSPRIKLEGSTKAAEASVQARAFVWVRGRARAWFRASSWSGILKDEE